MADIARRDVFQAIADPTRRKIIDLLANEPMNVSAIAVRSQSQSQFIAGTR